VIHRSPPGNRNDLGQRPRRCYEIELTALESCAVPLYIGRAGRYLIGPADPFPRVTAHSGNSTGHRPPGRVFMDQIR
jgi:hypothetical protein